MKSIRGLIQEGNFVKLFTAVLFSELGGYLTNTVILFYVNEQTGGSRLYLGLAQVLFVAPLLLGTLIGGSIGERSNKRKIMVACEAANLLLILSMFAVKAVLAVVVIRAFIVFFAGIYNPNRLAIMQEIVPEGKVRAMNGAFTLIFALLHSVGPWLGAVAYRNFGGLEVVLLFNVITYAIGAGLVYLIRYEVSEDQLRRISYNPAVILGDIKEGVGYITARGDLSALLQNITIGGVCLGIFFPTLLPFLNQVFGGDESAHYGNLMLAFGVGGVFGGFVLSPWLIKHFAKGRVLVGLSLVQAGLLVLWTQMSVIWASIALIGLWGVVLMCLMATYVNYVQVNVISTFRTRAFSIYDQSISVGVILGALIVALVGNRLSPYELLTLTSAGAFLFLVVRAWSPTSQSLYTMET